LFEFPHITHVDASRPYTPDFRESPRFERYQPKGSLALLPLLPRFATRKKGFSLRLAAVFSCITRQSVNIVR
jgi:hypothetical protein